MEDQSPLSYLELVEELCRTGSTRVMEGEHVRKLFMALGCSSFIRGGQRWAITNKVLQDDLMEVWATAEPVEPDLTALIRVLATPGTRCG